MMAEPCASCGSVHSAEKCPVCGEPRKSPALQAPTEMVVRVTSVDIPIEEVFTLVLRFTFAGVIVGGVVGLVVWLIIVGLMP